MADLTDTEIMGVMRRAGRQMTYIIANGIRSTHGHHNGTLDTARVLRRLKSLEQRGIVERTPSPYSRQKCWVLVEAKCDVGGAIRPGAMCGSVLVGGGMCGHNGPCQHRRVLKPNPNRGFANGEQPT